MGLNRIKDKEANIEYCITILEPDKCNSFCIVAYLISP